MEGALSWGSQVCRQRAPCRCALILPARRAPAPSRLCSGRGERAEARTARLLLPDAAPRGAGTRMPHAWTCVCCAPVCLLFLHLGIEVASEERPQVLSAPRIPLPVVEALRAPWHPRPQTARCAGGASQGGRAERPADPSRRSPSSRKTWALERKTDLLWAVGRLSAPLPATRRERGGAGLAAAGRGGRAGGKGWIQLLAVNRGESSWR